MALGRLFKNNHFLSLISNAVIPGLGMLIFAILARSYSTKDQFGNWVIFQAIFTLADTFRTGFLQTSLIKFYAGADDARKSNIVGAAWYWGLLITAAFCIINLVAYPFYTNATVDLQVIMKWMGITLLVTLPSNVASWILQAEGRFDKLFYVRLFNQGFFFLFICVLIFLKRLDLQNTVLANLSSCIIASITAIFFGWTRLKDIRKSNRLSKSDIFHFGKFSVGTTISAYLLKSSDTFIIRFMFGAVLGPAFVAVYNLPQKLMEIIEIPLRSFISVAMPIMSVSVHKDDKAHVNYIMTKYAGMLSIALVPVSIASIIAADLIIGLIGGGKYVHSEAGNVFRIFMCYGVLLPVDRFFGITLDILNQPRLNMIKVLLMLAVNIVGDFAGILIFHNLYGVAVGSIITFLAGVIYGYWAIKKYLKFSMIDIFVVGYRESKALVNGFFKKKLAGH
jgi:O-antigen/teichoic acid export membrane protein